ncbi:protein phosphatase regulator [Aspergillus melleus]|uniref:protein phosphatase regulator n=1 Tax=Aspergillus melleus TaxID=138277 RepID=UPI001E8D68C1|nr:protein phosphatase regulator [Aspergillus melleus]KAH8426079.1 protein phosphatase regulator [Aspergillus melleus]
MTRPGMIRADTMDLQDQNAPSAKDHSKHPDTQAGLAPHQEQTLRHADQDAQSEMRHGPGADGRPLDDHPDGIDIYDDDDDDEDDLDGHRGDMEDDLADGESDDLMDDDMMDKISSSPSIDDEDINFEFVYALHNFVATVDGQANAAKGDTMVLLDDSNSYWWLVRIVKDGSIGYLPAEHIETPTERLARLNKHRNVDLSATMLGDNSEKSKNPLKKAMRRRNAKTVTFTSPTYIEASDIEFSTDDELDDGASFNDEDLAREDGEDLQDGHTEDIVVEPLRTKSQRDKESDDTEDDHEIQDPERVSPEKQRPSQELLDVEHDNNVSRSRNGTVRNTDSFFKDDSVETKKISLTPNLLRDEVNNNAGSPTEAKESRGSMEAIDKALSAYDKAKDDKKRKDKKPGMLSGLFKRKDKKTRTGEDDGEEAEKTSSELSRTSPQPKTSSESVSSPESRTPKPLVVQRQSSKLQKQPPAVTSPTKQDSPQNSVAQEPVESLKGAPLIQKPKADQTIRQVAPEEDSPQSPVSKAFQPDVRSLSSPIGSSSPIKKPSPTQISTNDVVESPIEPYGGRQEVTHSVASPPQRFPPTQSMAYRDQRMESPVAVSPLDAQASPHAPGLTTDLSSPGGQSFSPVSPPLSPTSNLRSSKSIDAPSSPAFETVSVGTPTWSDASLRSYLDDDNDIRDLFYIVHDNTNVPPAGPDHPITGSLFKDESKRLKEMGAQLDSLLSEWVGRRGQIPASK